ncbi:uncharacterized protein LOC119076329 [Bradysia coprophila]|uniref:uncharacterized protein LOC119076329 n=1 Tax=Bradysia coprophila TaxID=38358 RepID=UPI00187D6ED9|nr:uncharacterized protein LOC119076329 [Bradysia coprophila]
MDHTEDVKVIDLENSEEDEDDDDEEDGNGLSMDAVPFQEKVEKWLMDCNGAHARALIRDSERIFQEKTVVVKEVVDKTESLHSVDTEQYIKSNRRKTTTKVTTTTIKKYYSLIKVGNNVCNNNAECYSGDRQSLPAIEKVEDEKYSCKVIRKSPRKPSNNLPSVPELNQPKVNPKKRNHQRRNDCDTNHLSVDDNDHLDLDLNQEVPANVPQNCNDRIKIERKCAPYNTRLKSEARDRIRLCVEAYKNKKMPRRAPAKKKQNSLSTKGCRVTLKSFDHGTNSLITDVDSNAKTTPLRNVVHLRRDSEDSEQDDILLTSYKPFSLCP